MCLTVAHLIIARIWILVHYPSSRAGGESGTDTLAEMQNRLFLRSIEVLRLSSPLLTNQEISRWTWHSKTHIQWHTMALVLAEICSRHCVARLRSRLGICERGAEWMEAEGEGKEGELCGGRSCGSWRNVAMYGKCRGPPHVAGGANTCRPLIYLRTKLLTTLLGCPSLGLPLPASVAK